ncbi:large ribosomal subunit protein uL4m-like [Littorina saxatilis]|uniref:Large ribosomal subunit protein uL4m n=1 Tax=Littorina saxatilis TaxID=31220 RepID=A0AAN9GCY8_9CAEN
MMLSRPFVTRITDLCLRARSSVAVSQKACLFCGRPNNQALDLEVPHQPQEDALIKQTDRPLPVITSRQLQFPSPYAEPKQAWLETLSTLEDQKLGLVDLHPDVFGIYPRVDVVHQNILWQRTYKRISYATTLSRSEMPGGGRKPWPQKGTGRARHGSVRSPIWHKGGSAMGPRGPQSYFYMLSAQLRALGLRSMLSIKFAQDDLHIVENLDIPMDDPQYLKELADVRFWGDSVLFVDDNDTLPRETAVALSEIPHFNALPVYGLNVYSMLKHHTLVLTVAAVEKIEERLLYVMHSTRRQKKVTYSYRTPTPFVRDPVIEQ